MRSGECVKSAWLRGSGVIERRVPCVEGSNLSESLVMNQLPKGALRPPPASELSYSDQTDLLLLVVTVDVDEQHAGPGRVPGEFIPDGWAAARCRSLTLANVAFVPCRPASTSIAGSRPHHHHPHQPSLVQWTKASVWVMLCAIFGPCSIALQTKPATCAARPPRATRKVTLFSFTCDI